MEECGKEVIGSDIEKDKVTVVLETRQTKNYTEKQADKKSCSSSK